MMTDKEKKARRLDESYLRMATVWAESNSYCVRKRVGALIVCDGRILSDGYNGTPPGMPNVCEGEDGETAWYVVHAEANALMKLARLGGTGADGGTLYVTLSPCRSCAKMILGAGIRRVVYSRAHSDGSGLDFLQQNGVTLLQIPIF